MKNWESHSSGLRLRNGFYVYGKENHFMKRFLWALFGVAALTGLDQWTKQLAVAHLQGQPNIPIWDGVFELQFLTNRGAAFGIFQNQRWIFLEIGRAHV